MKREWKCKKELRVKCGLSSFIFQKGRQIFINQIDEKVPNSKKILINFGGRQMDWFPESFLTNNFIAVR